MDSSDSESPSKRRKLEDSDPIELSDDSDHYETVPTQIIGRSPPRSISHDDTKSPFVQVAASSPAKPNVPQSPSPMADRKRSGGLLANAMAPAGTHFQLPRVAKPVPKPTAPITVSDDESPTYRGGDSSDDESQIRHHRDIKPAKFEKRMPSPEERVEESPPEKARLNKLQEITSKAFYTKPPAQKPRNLSGSIFDSRNRNDNVTSSTVTTTKRPADTMASAYGSVSRGPKLPRQTAPSRAEPVNKPEMALNEIEDFSVKKKVTRMLSILTQHSVRACYEALIRKHNNFDDAVDYLTSSSDSRIPEIDLTGSDDELAPTPIALKQTQKQNLTAVKSIQEKYGTAQQLSHKHIPPRVTTPEKPRRRLIKGKKFTSSPAAQSPKATTSRAPSPDSDSAVSVDSDALDQSVELRALAFFNECSVTDLADTASTDPETARQIISHRPFKSLDTVRFVQAKDAKPSKGKAPRRPIGDRIVEKCLEMIVGYEAVDALVKKCGDLGKPIAAEMKKWGVDIFGTNDGQLELTVMNGFSSQTSTHDSGIGTPTSNPCSADEDEDKLALIRRKNGYIQQPSIMSKDITLKDYQIVGLNWLALLFRQNLSCILADEMGLGKTCQVIAFLAHLSETGMKGTHLVVVPSSTLENWLREFQFFCPELKVRALYGKQNERAEIRNEIEAFFDDFDVVLTTYNSAVSKDDAHWLRHQKFCACVYDEGHMLRNSKSAMYGKLIRIPSKFRLLLTGTPLQNNLKELVSLLGFILPSVFHEKRNDLESIFSHRAKTNDDNQDALLSVQRIARAKSMLTPFILRRKKHQVLKDLPKKINRVVYCDMLPGQTEIYESEIERVRRILEERETGSKKPTDSTNVLTKLRHAANHPLLFRRHFNDKVIRQMAKACKKDSQWADSNEAYIVEDLEYYTDMDCQRLCMKHPSVLGHFALKNEEWMLSGKVEKLCELLLQFQKEGHRTLIFSQFVMVLDILELVLESLPMRFFRLDGATKVEERQELIDHFYNDAETPIFLLSTRAGGAGINLAAANKVIIFDSSFNPQDDIQAENRAHRVGQTREVEVIRLVTSDTIDEQIYELGRLKVKLDQRVSGEADSEEKQHAKTEQAGAKMVEEMLARKLKCDEEEAGNDDVADSSSPVRGVTKELEGSNIETDSFE